jgi:hypothetical protein
MFLEDPPMFLGETLKGTDADGNLINAERLGQIFTLPYGRVASPQVRAAKGRFTGHPITAVLLRNTSGGVLLGKRLGQLSRTAGFKPLQEVDGYSTTLANQGVVIIDSQLGSAGVASNDIFWGIIRGPATILTPIAGADFNGDIAVGGRLVSSTGTTTGATTSGRPSNVTMNATTGLTDAYKMAANAIGVAMSARTTGETNADLLLNATIVW